MPSGKVHDRLTVIGAVVTVPFWLYFAPTPKDWTAGLILVGATLFSGLMLSPDLDLNSSIYKRWGPLRFIWWPYQKLIPHRSVLSHSFVLSPLLRLAYFVLLTWLLFRAGTWAANFIVPFDRNGISRHYADATVTLWRTQPLRVYLFMAGMFLGTALHVGADIIWSGIKKKRHRRRH